VLLVPAGADHALADELEAGLRLPLEQAGLQLERAESLEPAGLPLDLRLVVALPPDPGLAALSGAAPQVQFLAVGVTGLPAASNLSVIGPQGRRPDQEGFMAGVVAAMTTFDWRVGALSVSDTPVGKAYRSGFMRGAVYFCGLCLPYYGPIVDYPLYAEAPAGASAAEWQAAVQILADSAVDTLYVSPAVTDSAAWDALAQTDMLLISSAPLPEGMQDRGVVLVRSDPLPAVLALLPKVLAGQGGLVAPLPIKLDQPNPERFSPGRQARAAEILSDLLAGFIDPGVDLLTGDLK
jgi:hypothetical protein